jgi:hypothetical protein
MEGAINESLRIGGITMENKMDNLKVDAIRLVREQMVKELHGAIRSIVHNDMNGWGNVADVCYKGTNNMTDHEVLVAYNRAMDALRPDISKKPALWILDNDGMSKNLILLAELEGDRAVILGDSNGLWDVAEYTRWDHENMRFKHGSENTDNGDGTVYYSTYGYYDADIAHDNEGYHIVVNGADRYSEEIEGELISNYGDDIMDIINGIDANKYVTRRAGK